MARFSFMGSQRGLGIVSSFSPNHKPNFLHDTQHRNLHKFKVILQIYMAYRFHFWAVWKMQGHTLTFYVHPI